MLRRLAGLRELLIITRSRVRSAEGDRTHRDRKIFAPFEIIDSRAEGCGPVIYHGYYHRIWETMPVQVCTYNGAYLICEQNAKCENSDKRFFFFFIRFRCYHCVRIIIEFMSFRRKRIDYVIADHVKFNNTAHCIVYNVIIGIIVHIVLFSRKDAERVHDSQNVTKTFNRLNENIIIIVFFSSRVIENKS